MKPGGPDFLSNILMIGETDLLDRNFQFDCHRFRDQRFRAFCSLQRGVPGHDCYAAGIRAQINGPKIGVARVDANVKRIDAKNFCDDRSEHVVRTLSDFTAPQNTVTQSRRDPVSVARRTAAWSSNKSAGLRQLNSTNTPGRCHVHAAACGIFRSIRNSSPPSNAFGKANGFELHEFAVNEFGLVAFFSRNSAGSIFSFSAILSI